MPDWIIGFMLAYFIFKSFIFKIMTTCFMSKFIGQLRSLIQSSMFHVYIILEKIPHNFLRMVPTTLHFLKTKIGNCLSSSFLSSKILSRTTNCQINSLYSVSVIKPIRGSLNYLCPMILIKIVDDLPAMLVPSSPLSEDIMSCRHTACIACFAQPSLQYLMARMQPPSCGCQRL